MGQACVQGDMKSRPKHSSKDIEDCLNMNIFTPIIPNRTGLQFPVMVYVHGGFFSTGSNAEYPPSYLLEHGIVLVVPNYRLDALGNALTLSAFNQWIFPLSYSQTVLLKTPKCIKNRFPQASWQQKRLRSRAMPEHWMSYWHWNGWKEISNISVGIQTKLPFPANQVVVQWFLRYF